MSSTHDQSKATIVSVKKRRTPPREKVLAPERSRTHRQPVPIAIAMKRATLLRKPMSLLTPQQSRINGPSGQDVDEFRLIWEYVTSVCCFVTVLLTRYWGIVTVPGVPRVNRPQAKWDRQILTLHLNYVTGYARPILLLFERTHNSDDTVDNQGLLPWRLRGVGESKVRSASLVRVLSGGKIPKVHWSQDQRSKATLVLFKKRVVAGCIWAAKCQTRSRP